MSGASGGVWYVYILCCADTTLYTGVTNRVAARVDTHNAGRGARYTRGRLPVELVYEEVAPDRAAALRREAEIKRLSAAEKRLLAAERLRVRASPQNSDRKPRLKPICESCAAKPEAGRGRL
jgi:putative endonuclease